MQSTRLRGIAQAYLMAFGFWYGLAVLMGLQYISLDRNHFSSSFLNLLLQAAVHALGFALWTPPIFYLVSRYVSFSRNRFRYWLLWGLGATPFVALYSAIILLLGPPFDAVLRQSVAQSLHSWMQLVRAGFADEIFVYIAIVVAAHAYEYLKRVRRQEAEKYEYQQALAASELQSLKMQLHPHFLFNTLHGIATLADSDAQSAKAMIIKLSSLLRVSLDRDSADLISLEEELRFVRQYLDLEKMRFGSRLTTSWSIAAETESLLVPQMILQPLVENAIRHGIASTREGGWIEVVTGTTDGRLTIRVSNTAGSSVEKSDGHGVGLRNIEARLRYLYSGDASLRSAFGDDRIATVTLSLPALESGAATAQPILEGKGQQCAFSSSTTNL